MKSEQIGYLLPTFDHKTSAFLIDLENEIPCTNLTNTHF